MLGFLRRRRILARLARGEAHPDDPDVREALEADPRLASQVLALRTRMAEAHGASGAPGGAVRRRSRAATWMSIVLLLAALGMFVRDLIIPPSIEADAGGERRVAFEDEDASGLAVRAPEPLVDDYRTIAFTGTFPEGGWFKVEIRPSDAAADSAPILELDKLRENAWTPSGEERLALPDAIAITVRVFDAAAKETASVTQRSRRMR